MCLLISYVVCWLILYALITNMDKGNSLQITVYLLNELLCISYYNDLIEPFIQHNIRILIIRVHFLKYCNYTGITNR